MSEFYGQYVKVESSVVLNKPDMPPRLLKSDFKLPFHERFKERQKRAQKRFDIIVMNDVMEIFGNCLRQTEAELTGMLMK